MSAENCGEKGFNTISMLASHKALQIYTVYTNTFEKKIDKPTEYNVLDSSMAYGNTSQLTQEFQDLYSCVCVRVCLKAMPM